MVYTLTAPVEPPNSEDAWIGKASLGLIALTILIALALAVVLQSRHDKRVGHVFVVALGMSETVKYESADAAIDKHLIEDDGGVAIQNLFGSGETVPVFSEVLEGAIVTRYSIKSDQHTTCVASVIQPGNVASGVVRYSGNCAAGAVPNELRNLLDQTRP